MIKSTDRRLYSQTLMCTAMKTDSDVCDLFGDNGDQTNYYFWTIGPFYIILYTW
jgi:hypothetical protein